MQRNLIIDNYTNYLSNLPLYKLPRGMLLYRLVLLEEPIFPNGYWYSFNSKSALAYKGFGGEFVSKESSSFYLYELKTGKALDMVQFTGGHIMKFSSFYTSYPNHEQINNDLIAALNKCSALLDGVFFIKDINNDNEVFLSNPEECLEVVSVSKV